MSTLSPAQASDLQPRLDALKALRDEFYRDFMADQVIEPDEQAILDRIDGKLTNLEALLQGATKVGKTISGSVGKGADNGPDDVMVVQSLLNNNGASLSVDGIIGPKTRAAITAFQEKALGFGDCYVEPGGKTMRALNGGAVGAPDGGEGTSEAGGGGVSETGGGGSVGGGQPSEPTEGIGSGAEEEVVALPVAEAIEQAAQGGGSSQPIVIDEDPTDPEVADEIVKETNKHLPDQKISIKQPTDADGNALVLDTLKGIGFQGGEISVGMSVGPYNGTLKLKLTDKGQVEAAVEVDIVESIAIGGGSHALFVHGEFKPLSAEFSCSTVGDEFITTCELSTSGSAIAGIGAAAAESWAGLGKQIEFKVSQTQQMTASLSIERLIQLIKDGVAVVPEKMLFTVPCTIAFKGEESLILGGSGDVKAVGVSAAAKLTLEKWDPIIGLKIEQSGVKVIYDDLTKYLAYQTANAVPVLNQFLKAYETAQEVRKFLEDPSAYGEEQRKKAEEYLKFIQALPEVGKEIIGREVRELEAVIGQLEREYDESKRQVTDAIDGIRKEAEALLDELEAAGEDIGELAGGAYEDLMKEIDDAAETASEAIEDAADEIEKGRQEAERRLEEIRNKIKEAKNAAKDLLEQAGDALDDGREMAEDLVDDVADAVDALKDKAGEELADAANDVLEFADQVGEVVGGVGKDLMKRINEGRKAAEEAKDRAAEELREKGEEIVDAVKDFGEDAVEKAKEALEVADDAREKVEETVEDVWDLVQEATKDAERTAKSVKDGLFGLAGEAAEELSDLGGEFWDFAEGMSDEAKDKMKSVAEGAKKAAEAAKEQLEDAYQGVEEQVGEFGEDVKEGAEEAIEFLDETRKGVVDTVAEMAEAAKKTAEKVKKQMEDMAGDAVEVADDAKDAIEDTASGLLDQFDDAFDDATDKAAEYAKEAMKKAEEARKVAEAKAKEAQDQLERAAEIAMEEARKAKAELEKQSKSLMDKAEDAFDDVKDVASGAADTARGLLGKLGSLF